MSQNEKGRIVEVQSLDGKTVMSCAKCYSMAVYPGKVIVESCPECGSTDPLLTRFRHWKNNEPDYSVNLLKKRA